MRLFSNKKVAAAMSFMLVAVVMFSQMPLIAGLSAAQKKLLSEGVYQFDVVAGGVKQCGPSATAITLSGDGNPAKALNYLMGQGLTKEQATGVVINLYAESGVLPNRKQGAGIQTFSSFSEVNPSGGYGIAQWTNGARQTAWGIFAKAKKMDPLSLELQLLYLWSEFQGSDDYGLPYLKQATTVEQATWIVLSFFERPATVSDNGQAAKVDIPSSGPARTELDNRLKLVNEINKSDIGGGVAAVTTSTDPSQDVALDTAKCTGGIDNAGGGIYSADGYTFPLKTDRQSIIGMQPAWCYKSTNNCHHDYNASDIFANTGTTVVATIGGRVVTAKDNATDSSPVGTRVSIIGDDGWLYYYAHMGDNTLQVKVGQLVAAGQPLGNVGTKENAVGTDPHLHIDRLPGKDYPGRPSCSAAQCKGYPFDNIQALMSKVFEAVK